MIFNSLFFQIILAALAISIAVIYVQPTFIRIGAAQDAISQYKVEREKVSEVNQILSTLVNRLNGISATDRKALVTYMPDKVDNVAVSKDIFNLAGASGLEIRNIVYDEKSQLNQVPVVATSSHLTIPIKHTFTASVVGTYEQTKAFLLLLEQSNYPLEVHDLKITTATADATTPGVQSRQSTLERLNSEIKIVTYSRI